MQPVRQQYDPSFGTIKTQVSAEIGGSDQPSLSNRVSATIGVVMNSEFVQQRLIDARTGDGEFKQICTLPITFGDVSLNITLDFALKSKVSQSIINQMVFGLVIPLASEAASTHLSGESVLEQSLTPRSLEERRDAISRLVGSDATPRSLSDLTYDDQGSQLGHRGPRQLTH